MLCNNGGPFDRTGNVHYHVYQLEVDSDGINQDTQEARFVVKAKLSSEGNLTSPSDSTNAAVSGVFLASASFDFDNVSDTPLSVRNLYGTSNDSSSADSTVTRTYLATIGIIRSPCEGLEAVFITTDGVDGRKEIIAGACSVFTSRPSSEVSSFWHSHTIPFDPSVKCDKNRVESFFVWSIELCDGNLLCWSVPYVGGSPSKVRGCFVLYRT